MLLTIVVVAPVILQLEAGAVPVYGPLALGGWGAAYYFVYRYVWKRLTQKR